MTNPAVPSSSHRLPTQSASEALLDLQRDDQVVIRTGLSLLDRIFAGDENSSSAGINRGKVTEIWGPSGAGKTLLALQVARETLNSAGNVVWLDASKPFTSPNISALARDVTARSTQHDDDSSASSSTNSLQRVIMHTLSHLVALVLHPPPSFPPPKTKLLVIDSLNLIVDQDYPRLPYLSSTRTESQKWKASRRYAVLGFLVSGLTKLAALHGMVVIVTTGCGPRSRTDNGMGAAIAPGIGGAEWETGVWNRLVMFRDFAGRFIGVQKLQGKNLLPMDPVGHTGIIIQFEVLNGGQLRHPPGDEQVTNDVHANKPAARSSSSPAKNGLKRPYDEVADSDDDEIDKYGWTEVDDEVAVMADVVILDGQPATESAPAE